MSSKLTVWTESVEQQALKRLGSGIEAMGLSVDAVQRQQMIDYLKLMSRWNRAYNLTAVDQPLAMVERHILDSLSIAQWIDADQVIDAGTGAGLPGIPLAILYPGSTFVLVDSNGKKIRFVRAVIRALVLENIVPKQARLEAIPPGIDRTDIVCRALAPLAQLIEWSAAWLEQGGRLLAMKAGLSDSERSPVPDDYNVRIESITPASGSCADRPERCLVIVQRL